MFGLLLVGLAGSLTAELVLNDVPLRGESKPSVFATRITPDPDYKPLMCGPLCWSFVLKLPASAID